MPTVRRYILEDSKLNILCVFLSNSKKILRHCWYLKTRHNTSSCFSSPVTIPFPTTTIPQLRIFVWSITQMTENMIWQRSGKERPCLFHNRIPHFAGRKWGKRAISYCQADWNSEHASKPVPVKYKQPNSNIRLHSSSNSTIGQPGDRG
jgi:hypothetical protein